MSAIVVAATLAVRRTADGLRADLTLVNRGEVPAPIFEWNLPRDGRLTNNVFVVHADGRSVPYIGLLCSREPPQPREFVELAPGASIGGWVLLDRYYAIAREGVRAAVYRAYHGDITLFGYSFDVQSNVVTF